MINSFASARELFRQGFESSLYKKYMNENGNPEKKNYIMNRNGIPETLAAGGKFYSFEAENSI